MKAGKITRRDILRYLGLGAAGAVLAACTPVPTEAPKPTQPPAESTTAPVAEPTVAPATPAPSAPVTITMWTYPDDDIFFNAAYEDFKKDNPDITLEIIKLDTGDLDEKLTTAFVGGTGAPDLVDLEQGYIGKYGAQGGFVDLAADPFNAGQYEKDFPKFAWDAGFSADGSKLYFLYYSTAPAVIHYRRSLFKGAGLPEEPEEVRKILCVDWEGYEAVGETISKPNGPWMLDNAGEIFNNYRNQNAPNWLKEDGTLNINNETNLQGLKLAKLARANGIDAKLSGWTPEWENSFKETTVASYLSGDWLQGLIKVYGGEGTKGDWGMLPLPGKGGASNGGSTLAIPMQSQNKEAAWKYLSYFCFNVAPQVKMYVLTLCFPGYMPAWEDPALRQPMEWYGGQKAGEISIEVAKQFSHRIYTQYDGQIGDIVGVEIAEVLDNDKDPAQALADAEATAASQLELPQSG